MPYSQACVLHILKVQKTVRDIMFLWNCEKKPRKPETRVLSVAQYSIFKPFDTKKRRPINESPFCYAVIIYFAFLLTIPPISNMVTCAFPNKGLSNASALILRLFFESCKLFFLK